MVTSNFYLFVKGLTYLLLPVYSLVLITEDRYKKKAGELSFNPPFQLPQRTQLWRESSVA